MKYNKRCSKCGRFLPSGYHGVTKCDKCSANLFLKLPLVEFRYPNGDGILGDSIRAVRVVRMDDQYIQGFDTDVGNHFKKFLVRRLRSSVNLVKYITTD